LTLLDKFEPTLKMSQEDEDSANTALKEFGISQQDKIVCLCVRDSEYLRLTFPETDWNEHNHRDSDINTYVEAAELLAKMGYKVFRMGNIVRDKLESESSSVIDYANSNIRSELLDIYLFSHADFVITTSTGMDFLGALFRIPIGIVNSVSLKSIYQGELLKYYQPKEMMDTNSGQRLGLEELIERGYQRAYNQSDFASMNIGFIDNSSDDLCNFFSDMESLVRNMVTEQYSPKAIAILEKYKISNKNWAKLSPSWLTSHSYFLTPRRD
jgi:putative glycosyltransferase (TIGR04372 family)